MKLKQKKSSKPLLSDKISDALTVKPRADIEDDQVFGTKPHTLTRGDISSSDSEDEAVISDFRKRNVNLLSEVSKKYEGEVVSRKDIERSGSENDEHSDTDSDVNNLSAKDLSLFDDTDVSSDESEAEAESKPQSKPKKKTEKASDSEDFSSEGESDDYSITQFKKQVQLSDDEANKDDDEENCDDDEEEQDEDGEDEEGYDISQMDEPMKEEFKHVNKQNISEEAKKGACVRNQLLIWEGLLEMRIHLQRCMTTANQMPLPDTHNELKENNEFSDECNATKSNISNALDKFLTLQNMLLTNYPETKAIANSKVTSNEKSEAKHESDEEIPSDTDNEEIPSDTEGEEEQKPQEITKKPAKIVSKKRKLQDYEREISNSHKAFKPFRDSTIQKWNEKTRLATATSIKNKNAPTNTVLQQISYILSDREKLVRRTQLKRTEYDIVGYKKPSSVEDKEQNGSELMKTKDRKDDDEYIPEIFDDSDFYHQLLRELIECKSADISDPVQLSRQWIALQQMRSKMKRKVDTKATKGRKIKYVVHNKLVNYMAPEKSTKWTDESTNELFSSLFGKIFEQNNVGLNANVENGFKLKN